MKLKDAQDVIIEIMARYADHGIPVGPAGNRMWILHPYDAGEDRRATHVSFTLAAADGNRYEFNAAITDIRKGARR